jgi:histidine ammonia-lyase
MIWQYTAASLTSESKALSHPGSVDSIPTSAFQEDHVSMGSVSVRKAYLIMANAEKVVAIELMLAYRGIEYLRPLKSGEKLEKYIMMISEIQAEYTKDRYFGKDFQNILGFIKANDI